MITKTDLERALYPCVVRVKGRHGNERFRFKTKKAGGFSCYLPGPYGPAAFKTAYKDAVRRTEFLSPAHLRSDAEAQRGNSSSG